MAPLRSCGFLHRWAQGYWRVHLGLQLWDVTVPVTSVPVSVCHSSRAHKSIHLQEGLKVFQFFFQYFLWLYWNLPPRFLGHTSFTSMTICVKHILARKDMPLGLKEGVTRKLFPQTGSFIWGLKVNRGVSTLPLLRPDSSRGRLALLAGPPGVLRGRGWSTCLHKSSSASAFHLSYASQLC